MRLLLNLFGDWLKRGGYRDLVSRRCTAANPKFRGTSAAQMWRVDLKVSADF